LVRFLLLKKKTRFLAGKLTHLQQARFFRDCRGASRRVMRMSAAAVRFREKEKATQLLRGLL
jgi:hypothetical protein